MNISANSRLADYVISIPLMLLIQPIMHTILTAVLLLEYDNSDEPKGYTVSST